MVINTSIYSKLINIIAIFCYYLPQKDKSDNLKTRSSDILGYADFLGELKTRISLAQMRAALAVNKELILLYWQIGRDILQRQQQQGWGAKVINRLATDLQQAFPEMKGFSPRNLKYMRAFAEAYPNEQIVQEVLAQITTPMISLLLGSFCARAKIRLLPNILCGI